MKTVEQVYRGKKIFLTGHTGFKGAWLLAWLHQLGCSIKGYALVPKTLDDLYYAIQGDTLCESVIADIRNAEKLKQELLSFQPDFIFHLAAQPLVRYSYQFPLETYETNTLGTAYLLEAAKQLDKPCHIILITTDKVYENKEWVHPYRETDRLGGYDPYSASKAAAELVIASYRSSFFNPAQYASHGKSIAVARAGNVIGGGDWSQDRLIPDIIRALNAQKPVIIRNPTATRPWQHVLEPLRGYLMLGAKLTEDPIYYAQAYNFGPYLQDTLTVQEVAQQALALWGTGALEIQTPTHAPHEAGLLSLDIQKTIRDLEWRPKWSANQALENTILWYKTWQNLVSSELLSFTYKQIKTYHEA